MFWNKVIGQPDAVSMLQRSMAGNRIPHAILLSGQQGVGKTALAVAFAQTANCLSPIVTKDTFDACGMCAGCVKGEKLHHTNIHIVVALPTAKKTNETEVVADSTVQEMQDVISSIASDPYEPAEVPGATTIRIDQIRGLKRALSLSAIEEGRTVIIILNAEGMTTEASNAFLKTLEEPHNNVTIILTSSSRKRLLPTIVSRCQEISLANIDTDIVENHLLQNNLCSSTEARLIASFSEGSISRAYSYLSHDVSDLRVTALNLLRQCLKGKGFRSAIVDSIQQEVDARDRKTAAALLSVIALWLRDARLRTNGADDNSVVNMDQLEAIDKFATAFPNADYNTALTVLESATTDVFRNVSVHLTFITALLQVRKTILSPTRAALLTV